MDTGKLPLMGFEQVYPAEGENTLEPVAEYAQLQVVLAY